MTVMGDALMDGLSDAGSIPARSTKDSALFPQNVLWHGDCIWRCSGVVFFGNSSAMHKVHKNVRLQYACTTIFVNFVHG